jgi:hypothetical protein
MDRPSIVREIEQGFDGLFLFTTTGDGNYDIYQRVEDALGVPEGANVVCMIGAYLLEIAHMPGASVANFSSLEGNIGKLRQRFGAVRDCYNAMHSAVPEKRAGAIDAWHVATARLTTCLLSREQC